MNVIVNGESHPLTTEATLHDLLGALGLTEGRLAVELNAEIVPRSQFQKTPLREGDKVEIVHAIGGG